MTLQRPGAPANTKKKAAFDVRYSHGDGTTSGSGVTLSNYRSGVTHLLSIGVEGDRVAGRNDARGFRAAITRRFSFWVDVS